MKRGAIASSVGHDSHNICVVGIDDADMAAAVNRLRDIQGGFVVVVDGEVLAELRAADRGPDERLPFEEVRDALYPLRKAARQLGVTLAEPFLQVAFLPLPVIPHLKITDFGLVDVDSMSWSNDNVRGFSHRQITTLDAVINLRHGGSGLPLLLAARPSPDACHVASHCSGTGSRITRSCAQICAVTATVRNPRQRPTMSLIRSEPWRAIRSRQCAISVSIASLSSDTTAADAAPIGWRSIIRNRSRALSVLDILPTAEHFNRTDMAFAMGYWHWFFLAQPFDLPERLIGADPDAFYLRRGRTMFDPAALAEYRRCFTNPAHHTRHVRGLSRRRRHRHATGHGRSASRPPHRLAPFRRCGARTDRLRTGMTCAAIWRRLGRRHRRRTRYRLRALSRRGSARRNARIPEGFS